MLVQMKYLSDKALTQLRKNIASNLDRYRSGSFADLASEPGWDIPLGVDFDGELLNKIDLSRPQKISEVDKANSIIVGEALAALDPSTANEERIWVRLCHLEALEYTRRRWFSLSDDKSLIKSIEDHVFASGQTAIRDDQALSRLWWNYEIAKRCWPDDVDSALSLILHSADIRSNFVERIWMTSRRPLAAAVLQAMTEEKWFTERESNFRHFMKSLNRFGGGVVFETLSEEDIRTFVNECVRHAKKTLDAAN